MSDRIHIEFWQRFCKDMDEYFKNRYPELNKPVKPWQVKQYMTYYCRDCGRDSLVIIEGTSLTVEAECPYCNKKETTG
jgi:DNA-directed RNA polymerase subunit RPC12/RpoP